MIDEEKRTENLFREDLLESELVPFTSYLQPKPTRFKTPSSKCLKIAGIMDEFTVKCYEPECELVELTPDNWLEILEEFKPDLLFIESAWQGKDSLWKLKISKFHPDLQKLIIHARRREIPVLFWCKEDPAHYSVFLPVARSADYVFTYDIDCIPYYKNDVGHDRVYLLPCAAQSRMHNPIEKYHRKNGFCFAGSYYLKYPQRQRDFNALISAVKNDYLLEIYDRNYNKKHPDYKFPPHLERFIRGALAYQEIDKAYKGYQFGINMNSCKQSQSGFARRVYELAASNTAIISNFSRGMINFFGNLIIASDNAAELKRRLAPYLENEQSLRKLRLAALRHVFSLHTYRHRLEYIRKKIWDIEESPAPSVCIIAKVKNEKEANTVIKNFLHQNYEYKYLYIIKTDKFALSSLNDHIKIFDSFEACDKNLKSTEFDFYGEFCPNHFYGANYLTDFVISYEYHDQSCVSKNTFYMVYRNKVVLVNDGFQYKYSDSPSAWLSLVKKDVFNLFWDAFIHDKEIGIEYLALDEFNFIADGSDIADDQQKIVEDIEIPDKGIDFKNVLIPMAEAASPKSLSYYTYPKLKIMDGWQLKDIFSETDEVKIEATDAGLVVDSNLPQDTYVYLKGKTYSPFGLNIHENNTIIFEVEGELDIRLALNFLDANHKKLGHRILNPGKNVIPIPFGTSLISVSLRVEGCGRSLVRPMLLGISEYMPPAFIYPRSRHLILAKQYPAYNDHYKYAFLHSRLRKYKENTLNVDMFRFSLSDQSFSEFESVNIATANLDVLDATLASGRITHVGVHLIDKYMWPILKKHLDYIQLTIWIHGAEIQHWKRREFEFSRLNKAEIEKKKWRSDVSLENWHDILDTNHPNVHYIFISDKFRQECEEDLGRVFPEGSYSVIHNFIDGDFFTYQQKSPEKRFNIISIRPFTANTYANDLTVAAILELSRRPDFYKYQFTIIGEGELFDETVKPVRHLPNVILKNKFIDHREMKEAFDNNGIFLIPTRSDTQGVSRDEAMACGLVPVTTEVMAIPEFVDENCGFMAPYDDYIELANAIEKLSHDYKLFMSMSEAAAKQVRKLSGFEQTIARELELMSRNSCKTG